MPKWVNSDVLDFGLDRIKQNANSQRLIKAYTAGDSYATVNTNSIAAVAMAAGDFTIASASTSRTLTTAAKTVASSANSGATPDLHLAYVDTVASKVLMVTDEITDQVVTSPNPVNLPVIVYTVNQPPAGPFHQPDLTMPAVAANAQHPYLMIWRGASTGG